MHFFGAYQEHKKKHAEINPQYLYTDNKAVDIAAAAHVFSGTHYVLHIRVYPTHTHTHNASIDIIPAKINI